MADSTPMLLICGQVPTKAMGTDAFQEAPVFNVMTPCAKHVFLVSNPEELEATVRTAFHIAASGRPGPVVLDVPKDVQNWEGVYKGEGRLSFPGYEKRMGIVSRAKVYDKKARSFFDILEECDRPLIYAGGGLINSNAAAVFREFAETYRIPTVTTLMGIGAMDPRSDLYLHMLGMHGTAYANYAVEDCDCLIALGARFDDRVAGNVAVFAPNAKYIAHIDIDAAEIGKVKVPHWSHVGDAGSALQDLMAMGSEIGFKKDYSAWVEHINQLKKSYPLNYKQEGDAIQPQHVIECLTAITGGEAIISTGVGQHQMWAAQYGRFNHPRSWITSGSMGTMGFGLPAAIGAQFANPDRLVIDIDGDGSLRMNIGEMETITTYHLPVKVLLLNNQGDGMVRQWQRTYFGNRFSGSDKSLHLKNFSLAAKADGYEFAERLCEKEKLEETLERFIKFDGPAFLEVMIDQVADVFPMVGPGMGYKDMETGPYITDRQAAGSDKADAPKEAF
jgi:acetolactate synthase-1/2/3 large subunit